MRTPLSPDNEDGEAPNLPPARLRFNGRGYAYDPDERRAWRGEPVVSERVAQDIIAEREQLRAALRRAHDMLDAEHGHSAETWDDREAERGRATPTTSPRVDNAP